MNAQPFRQGRLKHICSSITDGSHFSPTTIDEGAAYVTVRDIQGGKVNVEDAAKISESDFLQLESAGCRPSIGDILFSKDGTIGKVALCDRDDFVVLSSLALLSPHENIDPRFLKYVLESPDLLSQVESHMAGAALRRITLDKIVCLQVPAPVEIKIQSLIANFLDDKTARIDALISEKERLVLAVREYEQAELSRILTQGLRSSRMAPTGRDFVTEAPAHWRVTAFKRALLGLGQGWSPQCESRPAEVGEWGVLKVGCVNGTSFDANENKALPLSLEPDLACVLQRGDVLVSRANTRELVGMAALVEGDHPNLLICDKLYRLRLHSGWVTPEFAVLLLRSDASRRQIELGASGASSSMQNISQDVIRELLVALPPVGEQKEMVVKAREIRESCNLLATHCEEHIARLREYRSSLISAAVTGLLNIDERKEKA